MMYLSVENILALLVIATRISDLLAAELIVYQRVGWYVPRMRFVEDMSARSVSACTVHCVGDDRCFGVAAAPLEGEKTWRCHLNLHPFSEKTAKPVLGNLEPKMGVFAKKEMANHDDWTKSTEGVVAYDLMAPPNAASVVAVGSDINLNCTTGCNPGNCTPNYLWNTGGTSATKTLPTVIPSQHEEIHVCTVTHPEATSMTVNVTFTLYVQYLVSPSDETKGVPPGDSVVLDCTTQCGSVVCIPSYAWSSGENTATKTISSVATADDETIHICTVSHPDAPTVTATVNFTLVVYSPGVFQEKFNIFNLPFAQFSVPYLLSYTKYLNGQPDSVLIYELFDTGAMPAGGPNFGMRLRSFYKATMSGNHSFFVAGDDHYRLEVADPSQSTHDVIAGIYLDTTSTWSVTGHLQWETYADNRQRSSLVPLTEETLYLLTVHLVRRYTVSHVSVGIQLPDGEYDRPISNNLFYDKRWRP